MSRNAFGGKRSVSKQILSHVLKNQDSQDTLEGIAQWWMLQQNTECAVEVVEAALKDLVSRKFLSTQQRPDGRTHYRLNAAKKPEIRAFLAGIPQK